MTDNSQTEVSEESKKETKDEPNSEKEAPKVLFTVMVEVYDDGQQVTRVERKDTSFDPPLTTIRGLLREAADKVQDQLYSFMLTNRLKAVFDKFDAKDKIVRPGFRPMNIIDAIKKRISS